MIETDADLVYQKFLKLNSREMGKALKTGLRKALRVIQKDAKANLKSALNKTNKKNPKYNDTLLQGIRTTKIYENRDGSIVGKVRIDSNKKKGSGSFRLAILERGNFRTSPRQNETWRGKKLKKSRNVGNISGKYFFKNAMDSNKSSFNQNLISEINNAVNKINNG